ncbi:NADH dehydrogenase (ubiquinone) 1 beta subcomplex subunit 8, partial [Phenoliferia sp. Uapishka_3]
MFAITRAMRPLSSLSVRVAYASTAASPPPLPSSAATYDPEEDPQLAAMGYPKLSTASRQTRGPYGWWDMQERVQFGEPVPENDDIQSMWAPDVHKIKPFSAFSQLILALSGVATFAGVVYFIQAPPPALPRAYPYEGLVKELSGTDDALFAARPDSANVIEE